MNTNEFATEPRSHSGAETRGQGEGRQVESSLFPLSPGLLVFPSLWLRGSVADSNCHGKEGKWQTKKTERKRRRRRSICPTPGAKRRLWSTRIAGVWLSARR